MFYYIKTNTCLKFIESLLFNIQYKLYLYEEINSIIKQFIIVLSIKDVMSGYTHLYSLQQWLKNILSQTSNLYWKALSSKYTDSNFIS